MTIDKEILKKLFMSQLEEYKKQEIIYGWQLSVILDLHDNRHIPENVLLIRKIEESVKV